MWPLLCSRRSSPTSIPSIFEVAPLETVIPEVKVEGEGEPTPDGTSLRMLNLGLFPTLRKPTHKVQKTRSKREERLRGTRVPENTATAKLERLDIAGFNFISNSATSAPVISHTNKHREVNVRIRTGSEFAGQPRSNEFQGQRQW